MAESARAPWPPAGGAGAVAAGGVEVPAADAELVAAIAPPAIPPASSSATAPASRFFRALPAAGSCSFTLVALSVMCLVLLCRLPEWQIHDSHDADRNW